jgi:hypothetical protein
VRASRGRVCGVVWEWGTGDCVWSGLGVGNGRLCVKWFGSGQREIVCEVVWEWVTGDFVWSVLGVDNGRL